MSVVVPWKPHLVLRRFAANDPKLTPGARRSHQQIPEDVRAEVAATSRSICHVCREKIPRGALRMRMQLQCHKGYKNAAFVHAACFRQHPEAQKVQKIEEVKGVDALSKHHKKEIEALFTKTAPIRKRKVPKKEPADTNNKKKSMSARKGKVKQETKTSRSTRASRKKRKS